MRETAATVVENRDLSAGVHLLRLRNAAVCDGHQAGRFVMIGAGEVVGGGPPSPMLRRPFSVQRVDGDVFEILYRVVGVGTDRMARMVPGQIVPVLGPLGSAFSQPAPEERAVLLGGGVGIPPMVALADALVASGHRAWTAYLGVGSSADAGCFVGFERGPAATGAVVRASMDGSVGLRGNVVQAWLADRAQAAPQRERVYACGPMAMLRAVARTCAELGVPAQVSVETMMGCGVGICMGCVIENRAYAEGDAAARAAMSPYDRWLMACIKGPVFDATEVVLDDGGLLH